MLYSIVTSFWLLNLGGSYISYNESLNVLLHLLVKVGLIGLSIWSSVEHNVTVKNIPLCSHRQMGFSFYFLYVTIQ